MTAAQVNEAARSLEGASATDVLEWSFAQMPGRVGLSTAFGAEGCVLIDLAARLRLPVRVFYIDTGFAFPQTNALKETLESRYGLSIAVYRPAQTVEEQAALHGEALYERDPDRCCALRKVEPMQRALADLDGWISARRRDMAATRKDIPRLEIVLQPDGRELVKVNPLATWTRKDVWDHLVRNAVPYSPLYDEGYMSIGCRPCTRPVKPGEDERAGRWAGTGKTECGIHTFMERKD
jgi:phosphoadenosine phosphosulfate reductase